MGQDLLTIARAPVNADAYNAPMNLADHGFPEFGPDAALIVRPHKCNKEAQRYISRGGSACLGTMRRIHGAPIDPEEVPKSLRDDEAAFDAYNAGYAALAIAGLEDLVVRDEPATAEDVLEANVAEFISPRPKRVDVLGEDGKKTGETVLGVNSKPVDGFDLEEGSTLMPSTERNVLKLLSLRPDIGAKVYDFASENANFPDMPDPLASRKSGGGGAPSTSSTETPPGDDSEPQKRGGSRRSSRKSSSG